MDKKTRSYLALSGSMFLAGSSVIAGKLLVQKLPVFLSSGLSLFVALLVLIPITLALNGFKIKLSPQTLFVLFLQGFTGTFLFRVFLLLGLKKTSAAAGGLITSCAPAIVGLLAFFILKEKLPLNKITGIVFTVIGIVFINISSASQGSSNSLLGNTLVLAAVTGEALFSVLSKVTDKNIPPVLKTTIVCFFAFICFVPFSIYDLTNFDIKTISITLWLNIIYYGLFVTVLAFILWFIGIKETPASTSAVFSGIMPLSSIVLSCIILKESISLLHILSLCLVLLGISCTLKPTAFNKLYS
jgi:drug/metabolite transporter (DMT)-like permease